MLFDRRLFYLFFVMFLVSACGAPDKTIYQDSWREDVLLSQECGLNGLTCCFNQEQKCQSGLACCANPNDATKGFCSETCDFGKVDQYCRGAEPKCDDTAVCLDDYCVECGVKGNPCCANSKCLDQDKNDSLHTECIDNICSLCGGSGELSCLGDFKCFAGNLDNGGFCHKCGGVNQPCCDDEKPCSDNLKCQLGFCS